MADLPQPFSPPNPQYIISQIRAAMPPRPVSYAEAMTVAELQANRLLELSAITEPPTPNLIITHLHRVEVDYAENLPVSGYTVWENGRWHIVINRSDFALRQRFTLAHEAKHMLDHPFIERAYRTIKTPTPPEVAERVADYFAACLLMPKAWVKAAFCNERVQNPAVLARRFAVSESAMRRRLRDLSLVEPVPRHRGRWRDASPPLTSHRVAVS